MSRLEEGGFSYERAVMTVESLRAYAEKKVAQLPKLTDEQCRMIAEVLRS